MKHILWPATALTLAACGSANDPAANATAPTTNAASSAYVAKVAALPPGQLRGVLYRAIVDGGGTCQQLRDIKRAPDEEGKAVWGARCTNGGDWVIRIGGDGVATVTGVVQR